MSNQNSSKFDIDREVQSLLRKSSTGKVKDTYGIIDELRSKYRDTDMVDNIMKKYHEKLERVRKLARKIKERLVQKHPNLSAKDYIKKIEGYKEKYGFDDSEMSAIINMVLMDKKNVDYDVDENMTYNEMSKALGFVPASFNLGNKLHYKKDEVDAIQGIIALHGMSKEVHNQVILSHLVHPGMCSENVDWFASYKPDMSKINVFEFVHPVVAALFLPKINILEQHMLLASIPNIVKCKYEGQEIATQPEYELYYDIATDPAETQCTTKVRPFTDLLARANVQTQLWKSVLQLRQRKPHTNDLQGFLTAIDQCRGSIFDAADMAFIKDEGTIMRKLLGAFSLRTIIVRTMPVYNSAGLSLAGLPGTGATLPNPGVSMMSNIVNVNTAQITTLSMVPLRIPFVEGGDGSGNKFGIQAAIQQTQLYIQNKQISVKKQEILLAREFVTFYINRRSKTFDFMKYLTPFSMASLPIASSALEEAINATICFGKPIKDQNDYEDDQAEQEMVLRLGDQKRRYALLSAVTVKTLHSNIQSSGVPGGQYTDAKKNLIVGSKSYTRIYSQQNMDDSGKIISGDYTVNIGCETLTKARYEQLAPDAGNKFMCYDPLKLGKGCDSSGYNKDTSYEPISGPYDPTSTSTDSSNRLKGVFNICEPSNAKSDIKKCGTLLIFVRCTDGDLKKSTGTLPPSFGTPSGPSKNYGTPPGPSRPHNFKEFLNEINKMKETVSKLINTEELESIYNEVDVIYLKIKNQVDENDYDNDEEKKEMIDLLIVLNGLMINIQEKISKIRSEDNNEKSGQFRSRGLRGGGDEEKYDEFINKIEQLQKDIQKTIEEIENKQ